MERVGVQRLELIGTWIGESKACTSNIEVKINVFQCSECSGECGFGGFHYMEYLLYRSARNQ